MFKPNKAILNRFFTHKRVHPFSIECMPELLECMGAPLADLITNSARLIVNMSYCFRNDKTVGV